MAVPAAMVPTPMPTAADQVFFLVNLIALNAASSLVIFRSLTHQAGNSLKKFRGYLKPQKFNGIRILRAKYLKTKISRSMVFERDCNACFGTIASQLYHTCNSDCCPIVEQAFDVYNVCMHHLVFELCVRKRENATTRNELKVSFSFYQL